MKSEASFTRLALDVINFLQKINEVAGKPAENRGKENIRFSRLASDFHTDDIGGLLTKENYLSFDLVGRLHEVNMQPAY